MRLREGTFTDLAATGASPGINIRDLQNVRVYLHGTFAGTWRVQISFDQGVSWVTFATGTEASALLTDELPPAGFVRVDWTRTSGTLSSKFGGNVRDL